MWFNRFTGWLRRRLRAAATPVATEADALGHQLTAEEFARIVRLLGRPPNLTELGLFSVMWSEHCSYKSSKVYLRRLPTQGASVVQGPGENAGAVEIGDGWVAVFKIESHNHPSYIEPYQGAATGVGGILRDIFTMGARPVALLDSLRFGPLSHVRNRYLLNGVIGGIAGYGNCIGVPTVGGDLATHEIYSRNPLVNVMCVGVARKEELVRGVASGPGNLIVYVGAKTGRDGIHGATMASAEFGKEAEQRRPTVQVGDPFTGKLLMEACLEAVDRKMVVGIQDMGAAGLTSSTAEMASRAGTGVELDLDRVPLREKDMVPYEILLSESQERMALVIEPARWPEVRDLFQKWDLDVAIVGKVTDDGFFTAIAGRRMKVRVPVRALTDDAPEYDRPVRVPPYLTALQGLPHERIGRGTDPGKALLELLQSPAIASKSCVYEQYDHQVGTNTVVLPGSDAAVIRVKDTDRMLAVSVDGNSRYCILNPYNGGMIAVAEAARNVSCCGARPVAVTNCLNFGSPERPETMWQFAMVTEGLGDACRALGLPIVSGNVSFYNETMGVGIYPTPVVGVLGVLEGRPPVRQGFEREDDLVLLVGKTNEELGGSEYLAVIHSQERGFAPEIDLQVEAAVTAFCRETIAAGLVSSAHDCSEGGLAVALAECIVTGRLRSGADVVLPADGLSDEAVLFSETQSRIVLSAPPSSVDRLIELARGFGVLLRVLGKVGGDRLRIRIDEPDRHPILDLTVAELSAAWGGSLQRRLATGD